MRALFLALLLLPLQCLAGPATPCPIQIGPLTLNCKGVRMTGISPLLSFVDCTATTDTSTLGGANNTVQDVYYTYSFGDSGVSGTGTWAYGANPGHNSMNQASGGPVAAHLYVAALSGGDQKYTVQVSATDGTVSASCTLGPFTAYDPNGANGHSAANTTCVNNSSVGTGCPPGAATATQANIGTAFNTYLNGNNKRLLFKCGDTFTGTANIPATRSGLTIGAYGSCVNTTTNRPIFQNSGGKTITNTGSNSNLLLPADIRIIDIDFEDGTNGATAFGNNGGGQLTQLTMYNLNCNALSACYLLTSATQSGIIASTATGMGCGVNCEVQQVYLNYAGNNCASGVTTGVSNTTDTLYCCPPANPTCHTDYDPSYYYPISYNAIIGDNFNGVGAPSTTPFGSETFRVSACRFCVFTNSTFQYANNVGAVFKFNSANTFNSSATWLGQWAEYNEISDDLFTGSSGTSLAGYASENSTYDERLRYALIERNVIWGTPSTTTSSCPNTGTPWCGSTKFLVSGSNISVRNNATYVPTPDASAPPRADYNWGVSQNGNNQIVPTAVEVYNNTCHSVTQQSGCVGLTTVGGTVGGPTGSFAANNLFYNNGVNAGNPVKADAGNTSSNNTTNPSLSPGFSNGSGTFGKISDYQPSANATGATSAIPNFFDACGFAWATQYQLGALSAVCP